MSAQYAIGIDLGHHALARSRTSTSTTGKPRGAGQADAARFPQLTAPGTVEAKQLLPSFLYLPQRRGVPAGQPARCRGTTARTTSVGEFARSHGAKVADAARRRRAKTWLCHPGVDRRAAHPARGTRREDVRTRLAARGLARATWGTCARRGTTRVPRRPRTARRAGGRRSRCRRRSTPWRAS